MAINVSLMSLRKVITALAAGKNRAHVPYRDAKLTSLLQPALGGNSQTVMVACASPSDMYRDDNHSTLEYACLAARITNRVTKQEDPRAVLIRELRDEIAFLRNQLASIRLLLPKETVEKLGLDQPQGHTTPTTSIIPTTISASTRARATTAITAATTSEDPVSQDVADLTQGLVNLNDTTIAAVNPDATLGSTTDAIVTPAPFISTTAAQPPPVLRANLNPGHPSHHQATEGLARKLLDAVALIKKVSAGNTALRSKYVIAAERADHLAAEHEAVMLENMALRERVEMLEGVVMMHDEDDSAARNAGEEAGSTSDVRAARHGFHTTSTATLVELVDLRRENQVLRRRVREMMMSESGGNGSVGYLVPTVGSGGKGQRGLGGGMGSPYPPAPGTPRVGMGLPRAPSTPRVTSAKANMMHTKVAALRQRTPMRGRSFQGGMSDKGVGMGGSRSVPSSPAGGWAKTPSPSASASIKGEVEGGGAVVTGNMTLARLKELTTRRRKVEADVDVEVEMEGSERGRGGGGGFRWPVEEREEGGKGEDEPPVGGVGKAPPLPGLTLPGMGTGTSTGALDEELAALMARRGALVRARAQVAEMS